MWKQFWKEINTPSDFRSDPYGELTNQCAHAFFGQILACLFCLASLVWWGDFPEKEGAALFVTLPYIWGELIEQRWRGWDTVADIFFYAVGGYGVLAALSEVQIDGRILLEPDAVAFGCALAAFTAVLLVRVGVRVRRKYG